MDLVNEYLRAVSALLPKAQREDIIAELRDTILTRIEEREGELGRPLTDDEVEAVLREIGHPLLIAARYREGPQHVVGPTLYPYWMFTAKVAIVIQAAAAVIVLIVRTLIGVNFAQALGQAIGSGISGSLVLIGAATVAAWLLERHGRRIAYFEQWRVKDLWFLEFFGWDLETFRGWVAASRSRRDAARSQQLPAPRHDLSPVGRGLIFIAAGTVFVLWWTGLLRFGLNLDAEDLSAMGLDPGPLGHVDWMAVRAMVFWPILAYWAALVVQGVLLLAHPRAARLQGLFETAKGVAVLGFCAWLWTLSPMASAIGAADWTQLAAKLSVLKHGPALALTPLAMLFVMLLGVIGCGLILNGLWLLLAGAPPTPDLAGSSATDLARRRR